MPAGRITVPNIALPKLSGEFFLGSDEFNVVLCGPDQALDATFVGSSGEALYADLTDEASGSGYTAGGIPLENVVWSVAGNVVTFSADSANWPALTASDLKYLVICRNVESAGLTDILAIGDLETGDPNGRTSAGGDFTIVWTGSIFTLTRNDA